MNALPNDRYPSRKPVLRRQVRRRKRHRSTTFEAAFKLGVNAMLAAIAISALIKLVPYNLTQQGDLKQLQAEVTALQGRVDQLQANFKTLFDPTETRSVMQDSSDRIDQNEHPVIWRSPPVN